jgi:hypothetical protein
MHTQETIEAVFRALLDPSADFIDAATELGLPLTEFLKIAESPHIAGAIEALEKLAAIRERALLARASHAAITALERIADSEPETPGARETSRKAAAQVLRMAAKAAPGAAQAQKPAAQVAADDHTPTSQPESSHVACQELRPLSNEPNSGSRDSRFEIPDPPPHADPRAPSNHANGAPCPVPE